VQVQRQPRIKTNGTNTATVTLNSASFPATALYAFGEPTTTVGTSSIGVTDTNGKTWSASGDNSWNYEKTFTCSSNPAAYTSGKYDIVHENTASIDGTAKSTTRR